ncbi:MAG TPA: hypothetical protein PLL26_06630, partial [Candidatus Dojkabacteria bacterium]|nr:hypothetical protein [Candidatus Dojkabacteria bacterium]
MDKNELAASVVFYFPTIDQLKNIRNYINDVGHVYIYDNTPQKKKNYGEDFILNFFSNIQRKKITYIFSGHNDGIGEALNVTSRLAIKNKYRYIITLDQDTIISKGIINRIR